MIYTTNFANIRTLPDNIIPISICGKAPDWWDGLEYKKLAPHYMIFAKWKGNRDNEEFAASYKSRVLSKLNRLDVIAELEMLLPELIKIDLTCPVYNTNSNWHIALVCYEKPTDFCHRHLVVEWLREAGLNCEEWRLNY